MKTKAFKIPLIYVAAGILWILVSDRLLFQFPAQGSHVLYRILSSFKGIIFVLCSGLLFFVLLQREKNKIARNNAQYHNIFIGNPNPMWFYDPVTFRFVAVNDAAVARYGYSADEFLAMTIFDIRPPEDISKVKASFGKMEDGLYTSGIWKHLRKNGSVIYVSISSHKTVFQDKEVVMVMAQDNTEKYLYEQQLKTTGEMLSKINNPVVIANKKGNIIWVNPSFTTITGYSAKEVTGKDHLSVLYSANTDLSLIEQMTLAVNKHEVFVADMLNEDKSGREYWVTLNLSPIFDTDGKLEYYISVQNDLTEHKKREMVIGLQNEKLKAVSWLNSHQIRKPVASILSLTELMRLAENEQEKAELLAMLSRCAVELDEIILEINAEASGLPYRT